jgi:hypothetical protein
MRCSNCNKNSTLCGCSDAPLTTNVQAVCEPNAQCPTPIPCSEYVSTACVYSKDGLADVGIDPGDSLEAVIQKLVLFITNPNCSLGTATMGGNLPVYADNAAALADGAKVGSFYRTGDLLKVVH